MYFQTGFPACGNRDFICSPCADQLSLLPWFWRNLVSTGTAFTCGVTTGRYALSSEFVCCLICWLFWPLCSARLFKTTLGQHWVYSDCFSFFLYPYLLLYRVTSKSSLNPLVTSMFCSFLVFFLSILICNFVYQVIQKFCRCLFVLFRLYA